MLFRSRSLPWLKKSGIRESHCLLIRQVPSPLPFHSQRQRNKEVKCNLSHAMSCRGKPSSTAHNIINPRHKESAEDTTIFSMCEQMVAFRVQFHGIICSVTHLEYRTAKNLRVQIVACFGTEKVGCVFRLCISSPIQSLHFVSRVSFCL